MNELIAVLVGAVGPTGGLLWFMYYTTTKTIPDIVADHRKELASLSESHRKDLSEIVMAFRNDLKEERLLRETLLKEVLERAPYACPMARRSEVV